MGLKRKTALKPVSPKKRSRVGKVTGTVRLEGKDLEDLRRACFERDNYTCQECGLYVEWDDDELYRNQRGRTPVGEMAHIHAKRNGGDTLDNVRTLCPACHHKEHQYGPSRQKPCPAKK